MFNNRILTITGGTLLGFLLLIVFFATSIQLTNTPQGEEWSIAIGLWMPWFEYNRTPDGFNWLLNFISLSFFSGLAGIWLLWRTTRPQTKENSIV